MIGVGAVIEDGAGRLLLVKHKPARGGFWQGKWICPGGSLELGETIEEGIKREVKEETNLEIELIKPIPPFDRVVREGSKVSLHVVYLNYRARLVGGKLKPESDVGEASWVEKKRLPEVWKELHEDTQKLLKLADIKE